MAKKHVERGVKLLCPCCGELEAIINLDLASLSCTCESCGDTFAPETARRMVGEMLARWEAVCEFIALGEVILKPHQTDADALPLPVADVA